MDAWLSALPTEQSWVPADPPCPPKQHAGKVVQKQTTHVCAHVYFVCVCVLCVWVFVGLHEVDFKCLNVYENEKG